jgi:hypothetical protein
MMGNWVGELELSSVVEACLRFGLALGLVVWSERLCKQGIHGYGHHQSQDFFASHNLEANSATCLEFYSSCIAEKDNPLKIAS